MSMDEEGLETSRTTEGNSSLDGITGLWIVSTPVTGNRENTPKLLSDYTKPSVVKGIRLKYVTDIVKGLAMEPVEASLIVSSKGPGNKEFTEVADPKTKQPVGILIKQFFIQNEILGLEVLRRITVVVD